jgi:hypothetical protein
MSSVLEALATARINPAKQCRGYRKNDQDCWHCTKIEMPISSRFRKRIRPKSHAKKRPEGVCIAHDQVNFDGAGR